MPAWSSPVTVDVRIMDLPQVQQFNASVTVLLRALAECDGLPEPVIAAMEQPAGKQRSGRRAPCNYARIRDAMVSARPPRHGAGDRPRAATTA
jgi:hypothetical protein